jgi:hypothetical protein
MSWNGGYVSDVDYIFGFYTTQSPALMALAGLLNGIADRPPRRDEPFHLCDIGCGLGVNTLITAAANPAWHVTGLDFNPAHIAAARDMARQAGLDNVSFLEVDLREFWSTPEARALPAFDAATSHGVWTWVDEPVQTGMIKLLDAKLKPGGLFHVSYNSLTGWQTGLGLQRLIREAGMRLAGRSDRRAEAGVKVALELAKTGPGLSYSEGFGKEMLERMTDMPVAYLAHEMMNRSWRPLMHGDVAARMAEAKLEFAGSTKLDFNFPQLTLSAEQLAVSARFDDPAMLELLKDICRPIALRNDVYVRGARRLDPQSRDVALKDIVLGQVAGEENWKFEFDAAGGKAQMTEAYYRPIFERLLRGPASVGELMLLPEVKGRRDNPAELIGVTIGTDQVVAVPNPGAAMDERCARLNKVLVRTQFAAGQAGTPVHFAVPAVGHGMTLPYFEAMIVHELDSHPDVTDPREMAARLAIEQSAEQREALAARLVAFFERDAPMLRNFGFRV